MNDILPTPDGITSPLYDLAKAIRAKHMEANAAAHRAVLLAVEAGQLLIQAKEQVQHGEWSAWLSKHCQFSERTARTYMSLARRLPSLNDEKRQRVAVLPLRQAIRELSAPRVHELAIPYPVHPVLECFPPMTEQVYAALKASIAAYGQLFPIDVCANTHTLLDGRQRLKACIELGIEPRVDFVEVADPTQYIISLNVNRQHLDELQLAAIRVELKAKRAAMEVDHG